MKKGKIIISIFLLILTIVFLWLSLSIKPREKNSIQPKKIPNATVAPNIQEKSQIDTSLKKIIDRTGDFQSLITNDFKERSLGNSRGSEQRSPSDYQTSLDDIRLSDIVINNNEATVKVQITTSTINSKTGFKTEAKEIYRYNLKYENNTWKVNDVIFVSAESL
jgi:hypothetical protein